MRTLLRLAPTLLLLLTPTCTSINIFRARKSHEETIVAMTVSKKLPHLLGAIAVASTMDFIVHAFFNETHRLELRYEKGHYQDTFFYATATSIDVGAKAYGITVAADLVTNVLSATKKVLPFTADLFQAAPRIGVLIWTVKSISAIKNMLLNKLVHGTRLGKLAFFDRLIDLGLGVAAGYNVLHILEYKWGVNNFSGLFAASGVSAIVFSLASKGMIEQMVGGLLLQAWDAIEVGEKVRLGDETEGTIVHIGLMETEVMGDDHVPIRVPNSQILGKRVHMLSRVSKSKVKQTLRFKYSDLSKIPQLLKDIQHAIAVACAEKMVGEPEVLLSNYEPDHIQVTVSCSFHFHPDSSEYDETKQRALFAIADAIKDNHVEFALPAIHYETSSRQHKILEGH